MFDQQERVKELQSVRDEAGKLDREQGAQKRPAITMIALVMVVWLVLLLFDVATGRSFTSITALALAAFAGLCWGTYRETHERSTGNYALAAGVAALAFAVAHVVGL